VYLTIFIVFACVFYFWRCNRTGRRRKRGSSLGNAFLELQKIAQPSAAHVLQEKLDERAEEDDESGPKNPTEHLRRSLKRIRNGEKIDNLKVFRTPPD